MREKVFRIQDKYGRGPWRPGFSHNWVVDRPDHDNLVPWYEEFKKENCVLSGGEHHGSACRTLKQLRRWFTKSEYKKLIKFGYRAVMIDVDRVLADSDIQCVFGRMRPLREGVRVVRLYPTK